MPETRQQKTCKYCDGPFLTRRKDRQYCSDKCRYNSWKADKEGPRIAFSDLIDAYLNARESGDATALAAAKNALNGWRR